MNPLTVITVLRNVKESMKNLNKCQASVKNTRDVVERKNFSPSSGLLLAYLFVQDMLGFQKLWLEKLEKGEVEKWKESASITELERPAREIRREGRNMFERKERVGGEGR